MTSNLTNSLQKLDILKKERDNYCALSPKVMKMLGQKYRVELAYTSNALEGNKISREETAIILEKGLTVGGKTIKEHLEIMNHAYGFDYVFENGYTKPQEISLSDLYAIHTLVLNSIDVKNQGLFRNTNIKITGVPYTFPDAIKIPDFMNELGEWLLEKESSHPVIRAADAHYKILTIHPFSAGNGCTARLFMNLLLLHGGYSPAIIKPNQRELYIEILAQAQMTANFTQYYEFIVKCTETGFQTDLEYLTGKSGKELR